MSILWKNISNRVSIHQLKRIPQLDCSKKTSIETYRTLQSSLPIHISLIQLSTSLLLSLGRYICWWTIIPRMYHPPSSRCFGTDMLLSKFKVPIHVIIIKTKVLLLQKQTTLADLGYPMDFLLPKTFELLSFERHLMKVIQGL